MPTHKPIHLTSIKVNKSQENDNGLERLKPLLLEWHPVAIEKDCKCLIEGQVLPPVPCLHFKVAKNDSLDY